LGSGQLSIKQKEIPREITLKNLYDSQQHTEPTLNLLLANNQHSINVVQPQAIPKRKRFRKTHETLDEKIMKVSQMAKNEMLHLKNNS